MNMTDAALGWNDAIGGYDVSMAGADLAQDFGVVTAILLSLLLDAPARPGDALPDPRGTDRRGWWGDAFLPAVNGKPDHYGSRLWLLRRAAATPATLLAAQDYAKEALDWMLDDGVARSINVVAVYTAPGKMTITVDYILAPGVTTVNAANDNSVSVDFSLAA